MVKCKREEAESRGIHDGDDKARNICSVTYGTAAAAWYMLSQYNITLTLKLLYMYTMGAEEDATIEK